MAFPAFDLSGGPALLLSRAAADATLLSAFGSTLALAWLAPPAATRRLRAWAGLSACAALVALLPFLAMASAAIGTSAADAPLVLSDTLFGHVLATRAALLLLTGIALAAGRPWPATAFAAAAVATQAGHDHAWAMADGPSLLVASNVAHLLAAGAWLGGLVPLRVILSDAPAAEAAPACRRFARLGTVCVLVIAATAVAQGSVLAGSASLLVSTAYGWVLLAKLALFLGLLAMAARNRFRLVPALPAATGRLARSIALETAFGLAIVAAAALLTSLPPAMAM